MSVVGRRKTYSYVTYPTALDYYGSRELRPTFDSYWALKTVTNLIKNGNLPVCSVTLIQDEDEETSDALGETTAIGEYNVSTLVPMVDSLQNTKTGAVVFVSNATSYRWNTQRISEDGDYYDYDDQRVTQKTISPGGRVQEVDMLPPKTRFLAVRMPVQMFLTVPINVLFGSKLREINTLSLYDTCGSRPRHDSWSTGGESNWDWICSNVLRKLSIASTRGYKLVKKLDLTDVAAVCMDVFRDRPSNHEWAIFPVVKILDSAGTLKVAQLRHKREDLTMIIRTYERSGGEGKTAGVTNDRRQAQLCNIA